jgi:hypothetical protein
MSPKITISTPSPIVAEFEKVLPFAVEFVVRNKRVELF